jgi:hypothetical protein
MTTETEKLNPSIEFRDGYDTSSREPITLGRLTVKQLAALSRIAEFAPGYIFSVTSYQQTPESRGSRATHVLVYREGLPPEREQVGLVGSDTLQYYDRNSQTRELVKKIAMRVYRWYECDAAELDANSLDVR